MTNTNDLTNPSPADLLAWAERNPERVNAADTEAMRAALAGVDAAAAEHDRAKAEFDAARQRLADTDYRRLVAPRAVTKAVDALKAQHAPAVLPDVVTAMVADGWSDVTHAVVAVPPQGYGRNVSRPPAADTFAALAQHQPGFKTIDLRLLRATRFGMVVGNHELRLDDFAIVGWPRDGRCGLLDPVAARAALGIPEPKAKKAGGR